MKKIKTWSWMVIILFLIVGVGGLVAIKSNADTSVNNISTLSMVDGASIRYQVGYSTSEIGLRYSMRIETSEYQELLEEIGPEKTYTSVSFGFLIAPEDYITDYGELTLENVFGKNPIYCYDGAVKGKVEIINMNTGNLAISGSTLLDVTENGKDYKETSGSITNLKEENLVREYRGVGYVKFVTSSGETSYVLYDDGTENICSMTYVAQKTVADPNIASDVKNLLTNAYIKPVEDIDTTYLVNTYLIDQDGHCTLKKQDTFSAKVGEATEHLVDQIDTSSQIDGMVFHSMEIEDNTAVVYANGHTVIHVYYAPANWSGYSIIIQGTKQGSGANTTYTCTASDYEKLVAEEASVYLEKATGQTFPIVYTGEKGTFRTTDKYIVIGDNEFTNTSKLGQSKPLIPTQDSVGDDGYQVTTIGKSVFIAGATEYGTVYGVYDYLNKVIGLDFFDTNEAYVDSNVNFDVGEYNYTDKPDFKNRLATGGLFSSDEALRLHFRTSTAQEVYSTSPYHNTFIYLNKSEYGETHPKWYSEEGTQLCYTAHGDTNEYNAMLETVSTKMIAELEADDNLVNLTFTQEDTPIGTWCTCNTCNRKKNGILGGILGKGYGSDAGVVVKFMNDLSNKLAESGYGVSGSAKRDITLSFFAYNDTEEAPDSGQIQCNENVVPIIAPYYTYKNSPLNSNGKNTWEKTNIDNWAKVADMLSYWWYSPNYHNAFYPYYSLDVMANDYKYLYNINGGANISMFNQGSINVEGYASGFSKLYSYVSAKLMWDTSLNVDTLVEDYFAHYFGPASESMRAYYNSYVSTIKNAVADDTYTIDFAWEMPRDGENWKGYSGHINWVSQDMEQYKKWFKEETLTSWSTSIQTALTTIECLKTTDVSLYNTLQERICTEKVLVDYWLLVLYGPDDVQSFGQKAEQLQQDMLTGDVLISQYKSSSTEPTRFILDSDARMVSYKLSKLARFTADNITVMDGQEIAYARKIYAQSENVAETYLSYLTTAEAIYDDRFVVVSDTTELTSYNTVNAYGWQGKLSIEKDATYGWYLNAYYNGGNKVSAREEQAVISFNRPEGLETVLAGCSTVKFHVYNGGSTNASLILTSNSSGVQTNYGTLKAGEWTEIEIDKDYALDLTGFGIYNAKYKNDGKPCVYKFSMMYGVVD